VQSLVNSLASKVALNLARARKEKEFLDAHATHKTNATHMKGTMKWCHSSPPSCWRKMCEIIESGVQPDKGFKEVHLTTIPKALFEHCGAEVTLLRCTTT
jgi:hypothetical protein